MLIEAIKVSKRYSARGPMIVEDISFTVDRGETLAIFGDSGSGKSTIGQILAGLFPVTTGEVRLDGEKLTYPYRGKPRKRVQILFQHPEVAFDPKMKLADSMKEPYLFLKMPYSRKTLCGYEETFVPLYNTLKTNLAAATDFAGLMDQYDVDYAALRAAASAAVNHTAILAALRADLALIPSGLSGMDETYKTLVAGIQTAYAALNDYQKSLLTPNETSKLEQIAALDTDSLTKLANVTVTFYKPGETEYPFATIQGTFSGNGGAALYNWPNWNWTSHQKPNGTIPDPNWGDARPYAERMAAKAGDYVYVRLYMGDLCPAYCLYTPWKNGEAAK